MNKETVALAATAAIGIYFVVATATTLVNAFRKPNVVAKVETPKVEAGATA